jgi:hypothetical protein
MKAQHIYTCELCERTSESENSAVDCEKRHLEDRNVAKLLHDRLCGYSEHDGGGCAVYYNGDNAGARWQPWYEKANRLIELINKHKLPRREAIMLVLAYETAEREDEQRKERKRKSLERGGPDDR